MALSLNCHFLIISNRGWIKSHIPLHTHTYIYAHSVWPQMTPRENSIQSCSCYVRGRMWQGYFSPWDSERTVAATLRVFALFFTALLQKLHVESPFALLLCSQIPNLLLVIRPHPPQKYVELIHPSTTNFSGKDWYFISIEDLKVKLQFLNLPFPE